MTDDNRSFGVLRTTKSLFCLDGSCDTLGHQGRDRRPGFEQLYWESAESHTMVDLVERNGFELAAMSARGYAVALALLGTVLLFFPSKLQRLEDSVKFVQ